jgi:hypothetical protein
MKMWRKFFPAMVLGCLIFGNIRCTQSFEQEGKRPDLAIGDDESRVDTLTANSDSGFEDYVTGQKMISMIPGTDFRGRMIKTSNGFLSVTLTKQAAEQRWRVDDLRVCRGMDQFDVRRFEAEATRVSEFRVGDPRRLEK